VACEYVNERRICKHGSGDAGIEALLRQHVLTLM